MCERCCLLWTIFKVCPSYPINRIAFMTLNVNVFKTLLT